MTEQEKKKLLKLYLVGADVHAHPSLNEVKEGEDPFFQLIADIIYECGKLHKKQKTKDSKRGSTDFKRLGVLDLDLLKEEISQLLNGKKLSN
jgi:hypothetical protein